MTEQERIELLKKVAELKALVDKMTPGEFATKVNRDGAYAQTISLIHTEQGELLGPRQLGYRSGTKNIENDVAGLCALRNNAMPIIDALTANLHAQEVEVYALAETLICKLRDAEADGSTANLRHIFADTIREALKKQEAGNAD